MKLAAFSRHQIGPKLITLRRSSSVLTCALALFLPLFGAAPASAATGYVTADVAAIDSATSRPGRRRPHTAPAMRARFRWSRTSAYVTSQPVTGRRPRGKALTCTNTRAPPEAGVMKPKPRPWSHHTNTPAGARRRLRARRPLLRSETTRPDSLGRGEAAHLGRNESSWSE